MMPPAPTPRNPHLLRYLLIGFVTVAPLWVTWLVFDFLFGLLRAPARPSSGRWRPGCSTLTCKYALAALFTLVALYLVGLLPPS